MSNGKGLKVRSIVLLAILGAWAVVLRFFEFPIIPAAPYLEIDFSDLMVLVGMLTNGPIGLIIVALVRDVIQYIMQGGEVGIPIGAIMSFTASVVMFLPTHYILNSFKNISFRWKLALMSASLVLSLVIAMVILNYYVALPIYTTVLNFPIDDFAAYIMAVVIPFNLIKGIFLAVGQIIIVKELPKLLIKRDNFYSGYLIPNVK